MPSTSPALGLLAAMITPAVLISACGTLIFSTSSRLSRIVDRVRTLSDLIDRLSSGPPADFSPQRLAEAERQLASHARRSRLIQASLTSFYVALGLFVAATISIALMGLLHGIDWLPSLLGVAGTIVLFAGCLFLIRETRLALRSVRQEMEFVLRLGELRRSAERAQLTANDDGRTVP